MMIKIFLGFFIKEFNLKTNVFISIKKAFLNFTVFLTGEFDSGSEQTLAACLIHASQTGSNTSGARVRNTWIICLRVGDNQSKDWLIPDKTTGSADLGVKGFSLEDESMRD